MSVIKCDFCSAKAVYDGKTLMGPWANMCEEHFNTYGIPIKGLYTVYSNDAEKTKVCRVCDVEKPLTEYYSYIDNRGARRHRTECKQCNLAERKAKSFRKFR